MFVEKKFYFGPSLKSFTKFQNRLDFIDESYRFVDAYDLDAKSLTATTEFKEYEHLPASIYEFKLYPNPASKLVNLDFDFGYETPKTVEIFSLTGENVFTVNSSLDNLEFATNFLENGIFIVRVTFHEENINPEVKRLIIQN